MVGEDRRRGEMNGGAVGEDEERWTIVGEEGERLRGRKQNGSGAGGRQWAVAVGRRKLGI